MSDLIGKTRAEIESELGPPLHITQWDSAAPPKDAGAAELEAYRESELHTIWVYPGQVISFNVNGVARQVDSNSDLYLPPGPAVA